MDNQVTKCFAFASLCETINHLKNLPTGNFRRLTWRVGPKAKIIHVINGSRLAMTKNHALIAMAYFLCSPVSQLKRQSWEIFIYDESEHE
jgi:hypothetical protein